MLPFGPQLSTSHPRPLIRNTKLQTDGVNAGLYAYGKQRSLERGSSWEGISADAPVGERNVHLRGR